MTPLVLVSGEPLMPAEQRFVKFAEWMGVRTSTIAWKLLDRVEGTLPGLAMSAETLARAHEASPQHLERLVQERCGALLVFGCDGSERHSSGLSWLTRGKVRGLSSPRPARGAHDVFEFRGRAFGRQLAGLSFSTGRDRAVPTFEGAGGDASLDGIMLANGRPAFLRLPMASCEIFLLAGGELPDIDEPLSAETGLEAHYDRLIPLLIFLRHVFGDACWHSAESTARLIIDDPLLTEKYGFLEYRALLSSMRREGYGTSIAFIPWNYRRTSKPTAARLFGGRSDLSICIHGCDHTNREFEVGHPTLLDRKAGLAMARMERHETRTGLPFDRVMVFPQGLFSSDAMRALRGADYLAAVNSTCLPTDGQASRLTIGDFLRPAITRFHGFPVFHRRYPHRLVDSGFDLFLGKPALLVEHHQYFRDGYERIEEFVTGLHKLEPTLSWPTLSSQLAGSCLMRSVSRDATEVQFFTRRFRLKNTHLERHRFRLTKHEPDPSVIRAVTVNGTDVPFTCLDDRVGIELEIDPAQSMAVEILDRPAPPRRGRSMGVVYSAGVLARRALSEFRDNTLSRHPGVLRAATRLTRGLGVTGERRGERRP
jgi:hypothetical protein